MITKIPKFRRCIIQNFPFIEEDFDALTDYQLLSKVVEYLNQVITATNNQTEIVEEYTQAFIDLQNYVDHYFDNLDVQQEINNKLDQMAQDGSFQPLLDITFRNYYNEMKSYTDAALENKIDKDGTGEVTYNNLSQSIKEMFTGGNTAVAGVNSVGKADIIDGSIEYQKLDTNGKNGAAGFNQKKFLNLTWENGTRYQDGTLVTGDDTITNTDPITLTKGTRITVKSGYKLLIYTWTGGSRWTPTPSYTNSFDYLIGDNFGYYSSEFYITVKHDDNTDISPSEGIDAVDIIEAQTNIKPSYVSLDNATQKLVLGKTSTIKITDTYNIGNPISTQVSGFSYADGQATQSTSSGRNRGWLSTPLFLPTGATVTAPAGWECVVIKASSVPTTSKQFYPNPYANSFSVQSDDIYYFGFRKADNTVIGADADQFVNNLTISLPIVAEDNKTIYVSGAGNDSTGDGSEANPYRQITKALNENPDVIICDPGYTYNPFTLSKKSNISIVGKVAEYSTGDRQQPKPIIDNSIDLTGAVLENGRVKISYVASEGSDMYACLVAKTKDLKDTYSQRSDGYFCTIFSGGDKDSAHRYTPVLVQDSVAGHFYYDGSYIYINPYANDNASSEYSLVDAALDGSLNLANFASCTNIKLENIKFKHGSRYLLYADKCNGIEVINCEFCGSSQRDNLAVNNTDIIITESISYLARNDGFNFHGFGTSIVTKCIGCNCFDDGISHHDQCTHSIIGGEYYGNGKGGISSPTYGCSGDIIGCYTHDNPYGIYSESNPARGNSYVNLNDNLIANNNIGIQFGINVTGVAYNNKLTGNTTDIVNNSSVIIY